MLFNIATDPLFIIVVKFEKMLESKFRLPLPIIVPLVKFDESNVIFPLLMLVRLAEDKNLVLFNIATAPLFIIAIGFEKMLESDLKFPLLVMVPLVKFDEYISIFPLLRLVMLA